MSSSCEPSPWKDAQHQIASAAQFQVMREMGIQIWDPKNSDATARLNQLIAALTNTKSPCVERTQTVQWSGI